MPSIALPPTPHKASKRRAPVPAEPSKDVRVPFSPDWGNISFLATAHAVALGAVVLSEALARRVAARIAGT